MLYSTAKNTARLQKTTKEASVMNDSASHSTALSDLHQAIALAYEEGDQPLLNQLSQAIDQIQLRRILPLIQLKTA